MHMLTDEYRLLRRLGRGGMGEVWEAARIKENHVVVPCAIKLLHLDFTESTRERELFFDEARIATQLDHSRIVKVIDIGTDRGGRPFLVMERVDGIDLRSFIKEAEKEQLLPLEIDITTYIIGEVLAALDYAHERTIGGADAGIIHSDVTPGNIMISSSGEVKLTDFGIARFAATAGPMSRAIGTPRYMSPEQLSGDPKRETDIYGLGVVLHEMLDGKRFLDGCTPDQFRARVLNGPPPSLTRADVPAWLDDLRRRMIATDRRDRPRASEARAVLIDRCPRYLAAGERLKTNYYARLIGRRRSGVTQLLERADDAHLQSVISQIGQQSDNASALGPAPSPRSGPGHSEPTQAEPAPKPGAAKPIAQQPPASATHTVDRAGRMHLAQPEQPAADSGPEHDLIDATEILPAHGTKSVHAKQEVSQVQDESISAALATHKVPTPASSTAPYLRWLAFGSGGAALLFLIAVVVLLVQMAGEPTPATVEQAAPPTATPTATPTPTPTLADTSSQHEATPAPTPPARAAAPVAEPTPAEPVALEPTPPALQPEPEPEVKPAPEPKPKPKPKSQATVGVVFLTASNGKIKVAGHVIETANRSGYMDLAPGTYKVSWKVSGADSWEAQGKVTIKDVSPKIYEVRLDQGQIAEVKTR